MTIHYTHLWTGEDVLRLASDEPSELVRGRIVSIVPPGGEHGGTQSYVSSQLTKALQDTLQGQVATEIGVWTERNPDTIRVPDLAYWSFDRWPDEFPAGFMTVPPELAVEIVSSSNTWRDLRERIAEYHAIGVDMVWVIDHGDRTLHLFPNGGSSRRLEQTDTLIGEGAIAGVEIPISSIFSRVPDSVKRRQTS